MPLDERAGCKHPVRNASGWRSDVSRLGPGYQRAPRKELMFSSPRGTTAADASEGPGLDHAHIDGSSGGSGHAPTRQRSATVGAGAVTQHSRVLFVGPAHLNTEPGHVRLRADPPVFSFKTSDGVFEFESEGPLRRFFLDLAGAPVLHATFGSAGQADVRRILTFAERGDGLEAYYALQQIERQQAPSSPPSPSPSTAAVTAGVYAATASAAVAAAASPPPQSVGHDGALFNAPPPGAPVIDAGAVGSTSSRAGIALPASVRPTPSFEWLQPALAALPILEGVAVSVDMASRIRPRARVERQYNGKLLAVHPAYDTVDSVTAHAFPPTGGTPSVRGAAMALQWPADAFTERNFLGAFSQPTYESEPSGTVEGMPTTSLQLSRVPRDAATIEDEAVADEGHSDSSASVSDDADERLDQGT